MKTENSTNLRSANPAPSSDRQTSLRVRTELRAGVWNCGNCVGTVNGNQMIKPACDYCRPS